MMRNPTVIGHTSAKPLFHTRLSGNIQLAFRLSVGKKPSNDHPNQRN